MNSVQEFDKIVKRMITNTQIILMRRDKKQEQKLREIWTETNIKLSDLFEEFKNEK